VSLEDLFDKQGGKDKLYGIVIGVVTSNKDDEGLGRVKVKFPWRGEETGKEAKSHLARVASLMAGKERGMVFLPEVDDEVLVAFEHGDINYPYVIGSLWNSKDKIPESNSDGKNNIKMIKTRSGHTIKIDDTDGKEKIEIIDKSNENKICIDSSNKKISIECGGDIEFSASKGKITINAKEIEIKSSSSAKIEASAGMDLKSSAAMNIKGSIVNIN
jgi:uncharacterized protein involved in type VI secretion and phage assembly